MLGTVALTYLKVIAASQPQDADVAFSVLRARTAQRSVVVPEMLSSFTQQRQAKQVTSGFQSLLLVCCSLMTLFLIALILGPLPTASLQICHLDLFVIYCLICLSLQHYFELEKSLGLKCLHVAFV